MSLSAVQNAKTDLCYFGGNHCHLRSICPAHEVDCNKWGKNEHFPKAWKSSKSDSNTTEIMASTIFQPAITSVISGHAGYRLSKSNITILVSNN